MQLRVLGPVAVAGTGGETVLGRTREAAIVADLVVHAGRVVASARLIDDVWRGHAPPGAAATLQTYVRNVRRLLGPGAIATCRPGYRLEVVSDGIDSACFERLHRDGRAALDADDLDWARELLDAALGLWRGSAFGELATEPYLQGEAARLDELRLVATEDRVEVVLRAGGHHRVCAEVEGLVVAHPYRERLWGQWMLALYRSGRQADALRAFQQVRRQLGEELGIEPSTALCALEEAILLQKPELDWDPVSGASPALAAFPPLSTVEASLGNLPPSRSPLIGRGRELDALVGLVRSCRLLTLTGVGGVGKSRLAREVAEQVQADFAGGVWWVELAPVGEREAVVGRTAEVLGVVLQPGMAAAARIASALAGRRVLVVVDNCEHVLDGAADVIDAILSGSDAQVIATSREGLGLQGERLWPVPPLDVSGGAGSAAVELFLERARALKPDFALRAGEEAAVVEICTRLDGIALAIELAAGRMLSMSPDEVRDRLDDRFRLLVGHRRSLERHQTLRHAIEWSYEVLSPIERVVLARCAVFAGGLDQPGAVTVCGHGEVDEYEVLDALDSLVRKSMLAAVTVDGRTRYHLLETIRQFGEEQLVSSGDADAIRDRFAVHFATEAAEHWEQWQGAGYRRAVDWVDVEMSNLRAAFRWAVSGGLVREAVSIAAHAVMLGFTIQRFEPVDWAEEILPNAVAFDVPQLPRVYIAAGRCAFLGRPHDALAYVRAARSLESRAGYDPFEIGWAAFQEGVVLLMTGDFATAAEVFRSHLAAEGVAGVAARCALLSISRSIPYPDDLEVLIEETFRRANERRSPFWIGYAMHAAGSALANSDPARSLAYWRDALAYTRDHRIPIVEALAARDSAVVEAHHGDVRDAYALIDGAIDAFHRAGDVGDVMFALSGLATLFGRDGRPRDAATVYATCMHSIAIARRNSDFESGIAEVRAVLGEEEYRACIAFGTRLGYAEAVQHAHERICDAQAAHVF